MIAYADWHAFGYAESAFGLGTAGHDHGGEAAHEHGHLDGGHTHDDDHGPDHGEHAHDEEGGALATLAERLRGDAYALVSKGAEAAAVLFATLAAFGRER